MTARRIVLDAICIPLSHDAIVPYTQAATQSIRR